MSSVQIDIELVTQSFKTALQSVTNQTKSFSNSASQSFASVSKSFQVMAGNLAADTIQSTLVSIKNALSSVIDEAAQSEQAIQNLNIALKSAGLYSKNASKDLQDFAGNLQAVTIYSDESILSTVGLFASLTNLDQKGIKKASQAAADLAATLNIDLGTASEMIAKAINGNTIGFSRIGITIQKADNDAQRLENTLKALSTQHGAAEAASNTYAGAIQKSKNQMSELLESVGKLVTQNPAVIASINEKSAAFAKSAEWISNNKKFIDDLVTSLVIVTKAAAVGATVFIGVSAALAAFGVATTVGTAALGYLATAASAAWVAVTGPIGLAIAGITAVVAVTYQVVKHWDDIKIAVYSAMAATIEYAAKAVSLLSEDKAAGLRAEAAGWRDKASAIKETAVAVVQSTAVDTEQASQRQKKLALEQAELARVNSNKLESARIQNANLLLIEQDKTLQEQALLIESEQIKTQTVADFDASKLEQTVAAQQANLIARQQYETDLLNIQIAADLNKAKLETDAEARTKAIKEVSDKAALDRAKLKAKQEIDLQKQSLKAHEDLDANKVANQKDTFSTIATLQNSSNKELAMVGKAAALTQIAIDTPVAISKAMAAFPPPFNFVAAGAVGVAMAAQAAQVAGIKFADGGIVPGSNMTGDRIRASLNSGEMVLNRNQQANLFKMANEGGATSKIDNTQTNNLLAAILDAVKGATSIQIDGREIMSVVRNGLASGRSF